MHRPDEQIGARKECLLALSTVRSVDENGKCGDEINRMNACRPHKLFPPSGFLEIFKT